MPGFVSLKVYELIFLARPYESSNKLIDAIAYSCLNYAIISGPIYLIHIHFDAIRDNGFITSSIIFFALFISPVLLVVLTRYLRNTQWLKRWLPHPTERAWDYKFGDKKAYWLIIKLINGNKYAGKYAYNSFSTSGAADMQIYLEEAWNLNSDGGFERRREDSEGILIATSEIESVEFFQYDEAAKDE